MKKKPTKALVTNTEGTFTLAKDIPEYLKAGTGKGMETVDRADLLLPRIKLLQALSPEVSEGIGKPGDLVNSVTQENYGREITIIPVVHYKSRLLFSERAPGAQIVCGSEDGIHPNKTYGEVKSSSCLSCELQNWTEDKKGTTQKPDCSIFYNFVVLQNGITPIGLSMSGSKIKVAKKLLSVIRYTGGNLDLFSLKFKVGVQVEKSTKGDFFNFKIDPDGYNSKEGYQTAGRFFDSIKGKEVTIAKGEPEVND